MAKEAIVYLAFHEPRRLRLPPEPVLARGNLKAIRASLLDDEASEYYYRRWLDGVCQPYTRLLLTLVAEGVTFAVNLSGPLVHALANDERDTAARFLDVLQHPSITVVCSEPKHSLSFYLDVGLFQRQMEKAREFLAERMGLVTNVAMAPHMCIDNEIYYALGESGFEAVLADGTRELLKTRGAGFLRKNGAGPVLCTRIGDLSRQLAAVLDAPPGMHFEFRANDIARQVVEIPGDVALLGWEAHLSGDPIDDDRLLNALWQLVKELRARGATFSTMRDILDRLGSGCSVLPLPAIPAVSSEIGSIDFLLGHPVQQRVFGLMSQACSMAKLTENEDVAEIALELAQLDVLELMGRLLISNGHRQEPFYLTPAQWSRLGVEGVLGAIPKTYATFIQDIAKSFL
ncbi:MAG: hypothetical protein HY675_21535 [Chloroflexi bacterium]|nr:hypothetical protein [Chloroflexota bacterium]